MLSGFTQKTQARVTNRQESSPAFSLIELMVVISIISVLVVVSLPIYNRQKIKATRLEARQNLNIIHSLATSYHAENDRYATGPATLNIAPMGVTPNGTSNCSTWYIGFSVGDCSKLRYYYNFHSNAFRSAQRTIISSTASQYQHQYIAKARIISTEVFNLGIPPISRRYCDNSIYSDRYAIDQTGVLDIWTGTNTANGSESVTEAVSNTQRGAFHFDALESCN